ncbi:MAG: hypothetical protein PHE88_00250 [Elusimicrobia bacterium]|nr:hypothetical protein [Elusimicrobiota bacterium]
MAKKEIEICYLCGNMLSGKVDKDHVPPKQFYATRVRKKDSPNLFTLPVHRKCHEPYQIDEDYFVHSIAPLTMESDTGSEIWKDIVCRRKRPAGSRLHKMVFKEFETRPSGLILPYNKVLKRFNGERVWRVVWKITRGLFFKECGQFLPDRTPRINKIYSEGQRPDLEFEYIRNISSKGQYPAVFDYKYIIIPELNKFHFWGMLFWDKLIMQIGFHDPGCFCKKCKTIATN